MITTACITLRLRNMWKHTEVYDRAMSWVRDYYEKYSLAVQQSYGISYINGRIYVHDVGFVCDEDKLIFMLTFPELC